jgi:SAM-dependent methyltransferase
VIDIACGEGFYTRMIRRRGAAKVSGVDLSEKMIGLARVSEAQQQLGIDYMVGDGLSLGVETQYDLAVAAYFLSYAHDCEELDAMRVGAALTAGAGDLTLKFRGFTMGGIGTATFGAIILYQILGWNSAPNEDTLT